jgi:hypothetical protein
MFTRRRKCKVPIEMIVAVLLITAILIWAMQFA